MSEEEQGKLDSRDQTFVQESEDRTNLRRKIRIMADFLFFTLQGLYAKYKVNHLADKHRNL